MILALTIIHIVIAVILILTVLLQHGKQQGMSGAIAGGAETFFGKNKGRTIDAMLKKFTAVFAILFIISSLALTALSANEYKNSAETTEATETTTDAATEGEGTPVEVTTDENGNLVDADGNILMTAEQMAQQQAAAEAEGEAAPAEEAPAEEVPAEEASAEEAAAE